MENVGRVWNSLKPGETVIIEHDSLTSPALGLYHAVKWAREKGYRVVVDDILDTLYLYRVHLKLAGFNVDVFDDVETIKEGGLQNVGKVVAHLQLKQYAIRQAEYKRVFDPLLSGGGAIVNPVLGIERLFLISNLRESMNTLNAILRYTGDDRRIALYFVNMDLLKFGGPYILPLLEEIATTVVKVTKDGRHLKLSVVKSVNNELDGIEIVLPPEQGSTR